MTIHNREARFLQIVERILGEQDHDGLSVGYHLETKTLAVPCEHEGIEFKDVWRLSLWITPEDTKGGLYVAASLEYSDGTEETIEELARTVWEQYEFGLVMQQAGELDAMLEPEAEGP